uniref:GAE domain-containing protein n=2 Tax=Chrysotila carterae TaxID=13221 RepID=A0A7S4F1Q3_CHRCT
MPHRSGPSVVSLLLLMLLCGGTALLCTSMEQARRDAALRARAPTHGKQPNGAQRKQRPPPEDPNERRGLIDTDAAVMVGTETAASHEFRSLAALDDFWSDGQCADTTESSNTQPSHQKQAPTGTVQQTAGRPSSKPPNTPQKPLAPQAKAQLTQQQPSGAVAYSAPTTSLLTPPPMQPPSLSASVGCTSFTSSTADFAAFLPPGPNTPDGVEAAANSAAPQGDGSASRSSHGGSCGGAGINAQRRTPTPPVFDAAGAAKGREVLREDGIVVRIVPSAATGDDTASATLCYGNDGGRVDHFSAEAAVPRYLAIVLGAPSGSSMAAEPLPGFGPTLPPITQALHLKQQASPAKPFKVKLKVNYTRSGKPQSLTTTIGPDCFL